MTIKSITPVRLYGAGNNGNWAVRARFVDGTELFCGHGAGHTLAQAQAIANRPGPQYFGDYQPLPEGVNVKA